MTNKLYLMCGIPGSGKSTFAKNSLMNEHTIYVSRDEIRFSVVKPEEEYFSKENLVFKIFVDKINEGLSNGYDVIADATHLNRRSRCKLLSRIKSNITVAVIMRTPVEECLKRNENRKGTRSYVPREVIRRMYEQFEEPTSYEKEKYFDEIKYVLSGGINNGLFHI